MKIKNLIHATLLLLVFIFSCKGQHETEKTIVKSTEEIPQVKSDYDPYFIESKGVHLSAGPMSITRNIMEDKDGNMWFASWEGIIRYEPTKVPRENLKPFTNFTNKDELRRYHVFSVLRDSKEKLWFGTIRGGLYHYDPTDSIFTNFTTEHGLANDAIGCMLEDRTGNIWIGTMNGISFYNPKLPPHADGKLFKNYFMEGDENNSDVNSIIEDRSGKFWFGTRGEVFCYDGKIFKAFKDKNGLPLRNVRSIIEDKNGTIWLGGNEGLWSYSPSVGIESFTLYSRNFVGYIFEDSKGNIWTGSVKTGNRDWVLTCYESASLAKGELLGKHIKNQEGQIFGIVEDSNGNIWFGHERGICRFDPTADVTYSTAFECFR